MLGIAWLFIALPKALDGLPKQTQPDSQLDLSAHRQAQMNVMRPAASQLATCVLRAQLSRSESKLQLSRTTIHSKKAPERMAITTERLVQNDQDFSP